MPKKTTTYQKLLNISSRMNKLEKDRIKQSNPVSKSYLARKISVDQFNKKMHKINAPNLREKRKLITEARKIASMENGRDSLKRLAKNKPKNLFYDKNIGKYKWYLYPD